MREVLTETFGALLGVLSAAALIVLMAIVATTVALSNSLDSFSKPEFVDAKIGIFANALDRFQTDMARYPTTAEGLGADGRSGGEGSDTDISSRVTRDATYKGEKPGL